MDKFLIQIKREFWECRASFIRTPVIMAGVLMALLLLGIVPLQGKISGVMESEKPPGAAAPQFEPGFPKALQGEQFSDAASGYLVHGLSAVYSVFALALLLVLVFYFADALYSDRRDQSILFWKSLPVAEHRSVFAKLIAGTAGAPLFYGVAAAVTGLFFLLVVVVYAGVFWNLPVPGAGTIVATFFSTTVGFVLGWVFLVLWLMPLFCWLLFSSAVVKKAPFMVALGIPIGLMVLEGWVLGSTRAVTTIGGQVIAAFYSLQALTHQPSAIVEQATTAFTSIQFWIGLAFSAALIAACVWLRNNRWEI